VFKLAITLVKDCLTVQNSLSSAGLCPWPFRKVSKWDFVEGRGGEEDGLIGS